jgi:transposase InsO family protein
MPWEVRTLETHREEFAMLARAEGSNISDLCRRFGISRKTGYKWLSRGHGSPEASGASPYADRSRRPLSSPGRSEAGIEALVVSIRQAHPAWGGRKIAHFLERDHGQAIAPSTVTHILHRHALISPQASEAPQAWQRFEHPHPNSLWQMDFKGHVPLTLEQHGITRVHPLTILDDHSRFNLGLQACADERGETVQARITAIFRHYGLPERINVDNGPPWGTAGHGPLSRLGVWLIRLGIGLSYSRPFHPQTNGKEERFHRTLKAEVMARGHFKTLEEAQKKFDDWRHVYNCIRPHEALAMQTPAQRYRPSARAMPEKLSEIAYAPSDTVRRVQKNGFIDWNGHHISVPKVLEGYDIALRPKPSEQEVYQLFFCHHRFMTINQNELVK